MPGQPPAGPREPSSQPFPHNSILRARARARARARTRCAGFQPCVARAAGVAPRGDDARGESGGERDAAKALYEREVAAVAVTAALRRRKDTFTTVGKVITLALDVQSAFTAPPSDDDDDGGGGGGDSDSDDPIEQEGDTPPLGALGCLGGAPQRI